MADFGLENANLVFHKAVSQQWKRKKYSYENTARPDTGLLYLLHGHITYTFANRHIDLKPGDVIYLPKGSRYEVQFDIQNGSVESLLVNFDATGREGLLKCKNPVYLLNDHTGALCDSFKSLADAFSKEEKPLLVNALFYLCLHSLQELLQEKSDNEGNLMFQKAAKQLAEDFSVSIRDLCKQLHMSRSAFQKKFIFLFGISPMEYKTKKRMEKAKQLLETTDMPLKELAATLGYYDVAYFYKAFKKCCLLTPKEYREKMQRLL